LYKFVLEYLKYPHALTLVCVKIVAVVVLITLPLVHVSAVKATETIKNNKTVHNSVSQGGPRRFEVIGKHELNLYDAPTAMASALVVMDKGAILTNLGCESVDEQVWCEVQLLQGKTRGFMPTEYLIPASGPDGIIAVGIDDSAKRARKGKFDGRDTIPCAQISGEAMGECSALIARSDGGDATIVVTFSNGFKRSLYFAHGRFISANATMSGVGTDTDSSLKDGLHFIRVDDQRYEIPDTFILDRLPVKE